MAIARNISRLLEDSEPLYKPTSRTAVAPAPKPAPAPAPVSSSFLSSLAAKYQAPATTAAIQAAIAPPPPPAPASIVAPPAPVPANPYLVSDTQYRGEPIQKLPPAPDYAAPAPVASTPANPFKLSPEALASIAALSAQYNKAAAPVNPLTPAPVPATTAAIQAAIAPPAGAIPSIQDYIAQKQSAFKPAVNVFGVPDPYSHYDKTADLAEYKRLYGAQANPWDIAVAETPGKESGSIMSPQGITYTPYTVQELQDQFLSEQTKLTPEGFNKLNVKTRPAKDYDTYLANYDKKFQALPENMKQRAGLQGELLNQAGAYGFKWDTTDVPAGHHTYNIAKILEKSNVKSVGDLEWRTVNGEDTLFNKATGAPVEMFKGRQKQLGWASQGPGLVNYMVEKDGQGNPVIVPQWKSNAPGGVLGTALKLAPVALAFVPGIGPALSAGAAGLNAVVQGGDIVDALKSAGTSYLGGQVGGMAGDAVKAATQSMAPGIGGALTGAATGGASAAATGALRGDLNLKNIATGALTGGAIGGMSDLISTYLPAKGELQDQIRAPGSTAAPVTGSTFADNVLRGAATRAPGALLTGGNIEDVLIGSLAGEAGKTAAGYIPSTGYDYLDRMIGGTASKYVGEEFRDVLGGAPSAPTRAPSPPPATDVAAAPAPTPATAAPAPQAAAPAPQAAAPAPSQPDNTGLLAMLMGMGLMGQDQQAAAPAPQVAVTPEWDTSRLYSSYGESRPQSIEELLKSLQGRA